MREELLYHLWKFQKFETDALMTADGESLKVFAPGSQNELSGPDFFNAKLQIGDQLWAGNVEMHLKSSDWYAHHHEIDPNYDNVILHVVWEYDVEVFRSDNSVIPTFILKDKVDDSVLEAYTLLLEKDHLKLNCENDFANFTDFQVEHWLERLFFERLEKKSEHILEILKSTENNWELTFFVILCRSFGSKVNANAFQDLAESFDFKILQKLSGNKTGLEAVLLGQSKLIKSEDQYALELGREYDYLSHKFSLNNEFLQPPQFFRLRPNNFPTIRLAQLAAVYSQHKDLFYKVVQANSLEELYSIFDIDISEYWKTHYSFGKSHHGRNKKLTTQFLQLVIINCIVPVKHAYARYIGDENEEAIQNLITDIPAEKNTVTAIFNELRPDTSKNAFHSQALLQLKNEYCNLNKCLHCELGASLLRKSPKYI